MTLGFVPGRFLRDAELYCVNLLLTYRRGCRGVCAYCGLSRGRRSSAPWSRQSFIRVEWPTISLDDVVARMDDGVCPHVERVCLSMITDGRARYDVLNMVEAVRCVVDGVSVLISPTIIDRDWLYDARSAGADMVGVAVDAATRGLFRELRGRGVRGLHRWERYWQTVGDAVEVFGRDGVGVHLIVGLGETEEEITQTIQRACSMGAQTHLFSFFPEEGSRMHDHPQPPIGQYRRVQLARFLIDHGEARAEDMVFDEGGRIRGYGVPVCVLEEFIDSGLPFMTSGCPGRTLETACNRPYANCTPRQAYGGEIRNYPFPPEEEDILRIREQLLDYSIPQGSTP